MAPHWTKAVLKSIFPLDKTTQNYDFGWDLCVIWDVFFWIIICCYNILLMLELFETKMLLYLIVQVSQIQASFELNCFFCLPAHSGFATYLFSAIPLAAKLATHAWPCLTGQSHGTAGEKNIYNSMQQKKQTTTTVFPSYSTLLDKAIIFQTRRSVLYFLF